MQGQEYLNQISASNRPVKENKLKSILASKYFLIGAGAFVLLIIIVIIGSAMAGNKGGEKNDSIKLYLHLTNTTEVVDTYQKDIKSSTLRGNASSLKSSLSTTSKKLGDYLTEKYQMKDVTKSADKDFVEEATTVKDGLMSELFEAKINGNLDRIFAHKMAYEIDLIASEEQTILKETKNDTLKAILEESYGSLDSLYSGFNDFSETK